MKNWKAFKSLSIASIKMYFRNRTGVFFTLFIPLFLILIFGVLNRNSSGGIKLDITNYANSQASHQFIQQLKDIKTFSVTEVTESQAADELGRGRTDLQIIIPKNFGEINAVTHQLETTTIKSFYNSGKPQNGQTAGLILGQIVNGINQQATHTPQIISLKNEGIKTNNLGVIDFLLPGFIAFSIMQLGVFSVAFGFINYKSSGALKRLQVTPTHPINFILAQSTARIIINWLQVLLLLGLGVAFFSVHLIGNVINFMILATLGAVVFLAIGFAIAGWARDENQAAPVAQLISFPQLFLSGVFFPTSGLPQTLQKIVKFLPLTYLVDGLRKISNEGAGLIALHNDILGLLVWGVAVFFVATRTFKWE